MLVSSDTRLQATIIPRDQHVISRKQISRSALNVMYELNRVGYEAYLVGGAVRDLLLGQQPKDFDVATDATPEQVKTLFKRARIVGRRFKIVHVRAGREITEVTTFRAGHDQAVVADGVTADAKDKSSGKARAKAQAHPDAETNHKGMLLRDNVYGSLRDDALRRDFTVNALYYSVDGFAVYDYTDAMADLADRQLRIIGNAEQRYSEDPVRVLRAVRLAAKLDFAIAASTAEPLSRCGKLLDQVAPARLFDEMSKLFLAGYGLKTFRLLQHYQLLEHLFPAALAAAKHSQPNYQTLVENALINTDQRIQQGKPVTPAYLYAVMLWPIVCQRSQAYRDQGLPATAALQKAGYDAIDAQLGVTSIPKRFSIAARDIWSLQYRLENINKKRAAAVLTHAKFRAGYDFLLLRNESGDTLTKQCDYWTEQQRLHPEIEQEKSRRNAEQRKRRNRRRGGGRGNKTQANANGDAQ